jgi:tetratricopeptide (TPR) repeat protein
MRRRKLAGLPTSFLVGSTALALLMIGCGGAPTSVVTAGVTAGPVPAVDDESVHEVERVFWRMAPDDPARLAWRDALVTYRSGRTEEVVRRGDYDEVVQHLAELTALLTPADVEAGRVPAEVGPLARWVLQHGAPRGDEGRVMGALMLLAALGDEPDARRAERARIEQWGREARAGMRSPVERFGDLIQVWEQHEELAPSPEVLAMLARLYVEQRDGIVATFGPEGQGSRLPGRLSLRELEMAQLLVQRASLDVAAVYLRHGDLERAVEHVRRLGGRGGMEGQLVRILQRAQQDDPGGAQALEEVARGFARARPAIAAAICRLGARRFPTDARFPLCLARVASEANQIGEATAWYADAVRLAPGDRDVYDEALDRLAGLMEEGQLEASVAQSRAVARHALEILDERQRRWPNAAPRVAREVLLASIARAEMSRGNVREARERLEASLSARETREAHQQLGLLLERTGNAQGAAEHYRRALDMTDQDGPEGTAARAELLEHLGDAFRMGADERQAERMYRQSLGLWDELARAVRGARAALVHVRRGILLSRLGDRSGAERAFDAAMDAAPNWREPYAAILSHLVVTTPNLELAHRVLRRAQYQLTLEPQWKVYFALWVQAIARRASAEVDREVTLVFEDEARGDSWSARLAAFGRGQLDYDGLLAAADDRGQRAEAQFYQGTRLLGAGDTAGARQLFQEVLASGMVSFYEYAMAQELLGGAPSTAQATAETRR